jgi:hypothetical protein
VASNTEVKNEYRYDSSSPLCLRGVHMVNFTSEFLWAHEQNREKRLLASSCPSVRPSVRMEQLGSHWTDFNDILRLNIFFRKYIDNIEVSVKSANNGYLTQRRLHN